MDTITINLRTVHIYEWSPRYEGRWMIPRYRVIEYDMDGRTVRDEINESGARIGFE
jgi:hypothetical protein